MYYPKQPSSGSKALESFGKMDSFTLFRAQSGTGQILSPETKTYPVMRNPVAADPDICVAWKKVICNIDAIRSYQTDCCRQPADPGWYENRWGAWRGCLHIHPPIDLFDDIVCYDDRRFITSIFPNRIIRMPKADGIRQTYPSHTVDIPKAIRGNSKVAYAARSAPMRPIRVR